jgi:hypothetical protein
MHEAKKESHLHPSSSTNVVLEHVEGEGEEEGKKETLIDYLYAGAITLFGIALLVLSFWYTAHP